MLLFIGHCVSFLGDTCSVFNRNNCLSNGPCFLNLLWRPQPRIERRAAPSELIARVGFSFFYS